MALAPAPAPTTALRWLYRRTVPKTGLQQMKVRALNLWRIALAASEETIQGGLMAPHFLSLFSGHLSADDAIWLRWRDDLAASAEMRRAYSALYGRFFARGLLAHQLGLTNFIPLHTQETDLSVAKVTRTIKGDIPDWVAWDAAAGAYVLVEAKGSLTGKVADFLGKIPDCVSNGKKQFLRVTVTDAAGATLAADGWVGASRWATDVRDGRPVFLACDPDGAGRELTPDEREEHGRSIRRTWLASLAAGLDEPSLRDIGSNGALPSTTIDVFSPPTPDLKPPRLVRRRFDRDVEIELDEPSPHQHIGRYIPAVLTQRGLQVFKGRSARDELLLVQKRMVASAEPAWFVGLNAKATTLKRGIRPWSAGHGVVGQGGLAVFDLRRVAFGRTILRD